MSSPAPPPPAGPPPVGPPGLPTRLWARCLLGGLALWLLAVLTTVTTQNTNLLPTLILLGSFLVPGCYVLWACERHGGELGIGLLLGCFVVGGVLGVLGASVLEYYLLYPSATLFLGVGLIEEAVKGLALVLLVRRHRGIRGVRAGLVLGAAVGFGFAAFESSGYAFNALFTVRGTISLRGLVETEVLRGLLAPFGHGLWTALLGAALLGARRDGRFHLTGRVWATYLGVAVLHALWDAMNGIAVWLVYRLTATGADRTLFEYGYLPRPTDRQKHLYTLFSDGGLLLVALAGVVWLLWCAREARRPG
ncbi:PrsW family intramembrane metalloprotease [Streptomyces sp. I05A-00742]|uniref:PrsW family intramembrane metalloprotease n=1 Tax=Streptomyces sp. I05A-00742 TaxID=2732853 RepID=UPI0014888FB9|nr:PrsW family glutamic-type intramembrane protease [Streptomyces sp. I05A-00742]